MRLLAPFLSVDTSPLNSGGSVNDHMQNVYFWIFWASVVVGVFVAALLLYGFFKFRRKSDEEEPEQFHGNTRLEITWTILPFGILVALFILSAINMSYVVSAPSSASTVSVIGQQFAWTYYYETDSKMLRQDGKVVTSGVGIAGANAPAFAPDPLNAGSVMFVPENGAANLKLSTTDPPAKCSGKGTGGLVARSGQTYADAAADLGCGVNHSFYVPTLAGQMNAIPGQVNTMWLDARKGIYYGQCTELCGTGHANMLIEVVSVPIQDYHCLLQNADASPRLATASISPATLKTCKVAT